MIVRQEWLIERASGQRPHGSLLLLWCGLSVAVLLFFAQPAAGFIQPRRSPLPEIDLRIVPVAPPVSDAQKAELEQLHSRLPQARVDFHSLLGSPALISARDRFLTSRSGGPTVPSAVSLAAFNSTDPHAIIKGFLNDHAGLFGFDAQAISNAIISREFVATNNGMRTVVWEQQVDSIPVFEGLLIGHITESGELVNISSQFIPDPAGAADRGVGDRAGLVAAPPFSAAGAVAIAGRSIGEDTSEESVFQEANVAQMSAATRVSGRGQFHAANILGTAETSLVWLPMSKDFMKLCWDVILTGKTRSEMYRVLVDAQSGAVLLRRCLTEYISDVTYRVYTNDSPSPMSPGFATPVSTQPAQVPQVLVTTPALDTNASPAGWIDDGNNETVGNNVDAHLDRNADNQPDLPRPQGSPARSFTFSVNLGRDPTNYGPSAVVQLFYICNWMHDRLYELGFTEAAGNFQSNNFGRGGLGNDLVQADAQDGSGTDNANFSTPPDGSKPRMQMYVWSGPTPRRDGDLDSEIMLHECTHGLSNRRVGGGALISALQTRGMGEGWSDFYALSLLSQPADNINGNFGEGSYCSYKLNDPNFLQNYYFGIRRYPYTTDMTKNPLTLNDIDTLRFDHCVSGAPYNIAVSGPCNSAPPAEVHDQGEVWCETLWEVRANLLNKYGWGTGNELALQLVTDGMNLCPPNPTFLQARDAIIQADLVDTGGANRKELWAAFAKRGMGISAAVPANSTTTGVHEAFDVPDDLQIAPGLGASGSSVLGGSLAPGCQTFTLSNTGATAVAWTLTTSQPWLTLSLSSGLLAAASTNTVDICFSTASLPIGSYSGTVTFSNGNSGVVQSRTMSLAITPPVILSFPLDSDPGWSRQGQWAFGTPAGSGGSTHGNSDPTAGATGSSVFGYNLAGDYGTVPGTVAYLTAGPFNLSGLSNSRLAFQRWLNTDTVPFVYATVEVSTNAITWSAVWTNGFTEIADSTWSRVVYDISAIADDQPTVYVRWGHRTGGQGNAYTYSGWNIDDVQILAIPSPQMNLTSTNMSLSWPVAAGLVLETSPTLIPAAWSAVTNTPAQIGNSFVLPISPSDPQAFYRLRFSP
jgi:hypothetical protein